METGTTPMEKGHTTHTQPHEPLLMGWIVRQGIQCISLSIHGPDDGGFWPVDMGPANVGP